ncbi:MAG: glycosyltransferase family 4 protein [Candidatus Acidoferrales bacterium]
MRIVILYCWYPPLPPGREDGGADYVKRFAETLAGRGWEVHVLTSHPELSGGLGESEAGERLFVHRVVREWGVRGLGKGEFGRMRRLLSEIRPEVINVVFPGAKVRNRYALPCLIKILYPGVPVITTLFHLIHPRSLRNPFYLGLVALLYLSSRKLCFQEERHLKIFRWLFPFLRRRAVLIPCGCNIEISEEYSLAASRRMREQLGLDPDYRYVAFYGYWYPSKNVHVLVEAVHRLVRKGEKGKLLFVGGRDREHITTAYGRRVLRLITELGLWEAVVMTGHCEEKTLNRYLLSSDLCVLPFSDRTLGRGTLFEVMALGVPLVTTQTADSDFLRHGHNAFLVPSPEPACLQTAIEQLLEQDELRVQLVGGARAAAEKFSWPALMSQWESLLAEMQVPVGGGEWLRPSGRTTRR